MRFRAPSRYLLFAEAALCTGIARAAVCCLAFRTIAAALGRPMTQSPRTVSELQARRAQIVAWAVAAAARRMPWSCNCLIRALAATLMLRRRGISSTLTFGVALGAAGGGFRAHAWVRCGNRILTGSAGRRGVTPVASFASQGTPGPLVE